MACKHSDWPETNNCMRIQNHLFTLVSEEPLVISWEVAFKKATSKIILNWYLLETLFINHGSSVQIRTPCIDRIHRWNPWVSHSKSLEVTQQLSWNKYLWIFMWFLKTFYISWIYTKYKIMDEHTWNFIIGKDKDTLKVQNFIYPYLLESDGSAFMMECTH